MQTGYLDPGSHGVAGFIPDRIVDADNLATAIAANPEQYARAIETCLPLARQANADLRSIYLGLQGALPEEELPQIYILFGAGNSGGTATDGAQILGLEVLCSLAETPEEFRRLLRHYFAHETVHTFQEKYATGDADDPLLRTVLSEGAADFIAQLVTGKEPDPARGSWARLREAELWRQFEFDIAITRHRENNDSSTLTDPEAKAMGRWVANYGNAPEGWPGELGYWIGLRIWERYYVSADDKRAALREMLVLSEPRAVLAAGRPE